MKIGRTNASVGGGGVSIIPITWSGLKSLRDAGTLVPGQSYRITDYTTTTTQVDTQSAGHDFDIAVTALSTNELSENAECVRKAGDTYFENANLEAWEIKYCIDNDTSRFAWADASNGFGVVYYMKDERDNECDYDFKNIQFLKDLNYYYTFDLCTDGIEHRDYSIVSQHILCTSNKISMVAGDDSVNSKMLYLNIFKHTSITSRCIKNEVFGYNNVFGSDVMMNKFGEIFYDNTIGNGAIFNTFTGYNNGNIIGDNLTLNTIHTIADCSFGNDVANNIINMCNNVTLNNNCAGNTFSGYSSDIILQANSIMNNFGEYVANLTFSHSMISCIIKNGTQNCNFTLNPSIGADRILYTVFNVPPVDGQTINVEIEKTPLDNGVNYTWVVDKNMSDEIVQYCLGDVIDKLGTNVKNVTYNELVNLRGSGTLIPDMDYRITDYNATTNQTDTQSAGHAYDIVVTAIGNDILSENAKVVKHVGDTYFENVKLEEWEIKYCLDNDTSRFAWADTVNGKGVIYYMKDEWNNECPYDFKNIQFKKSNVFLYTFGGTTDDSLTGGCHHNTMINYISSSVLTFNFNTFGTNCYSNKFGDDCYSNTFGDDCFSNTFGNWCYSNTFGNYCNSNTFGDGCYSNTFGHGCGYNTFSDGCSDNTFGDGCAYNKFNYGCYSNTFGSGCYFNTFGNYCYSNNFYDGISGTTKKDYIIYIVLEDGCSYNNFYSTLTTSDESFLQRIRIKGLEHTTPTDTIITLPANTKYEWVICYTSGNVLKQYCPDDHLTNNNTSKLVDTEVSNWDISAKYDDFDYQAQIDITNLTEDDFVNVVFGVNEANSGNYASAIEQHTGYILVFSKVNTTITIPTIAVTKIN